MAAKIIKDFDGKFLKRLQRALSGKAKKVVHVGFPEGGPDKENGISVAGVAAVHEFGGGNVPERPFMRTGLKKGAQQQVALNKRTLKAVVNGAYTVTQALDALGELGVTQVKREILGGEFVPLDPKTIAARKRKFSKGYARKIAKKGNSDKPLMDTGQMFQSVTHEIPE